MAGVKRVGEQARWQKGRQSLSYNPVLNITTMTIAWTPDMDVWYIYNNNDMKKLKVCPSKKVKVGKTEGETASEKAVRRAEKLLENKKNNHTHERK